MKTILGGSLDIAFKESGIGAVKTYEGKTYFDDKTQVWELSDENYEKLCRFTDEDWKENWGWWRGAEGSNLGSVHKRYNINNHYLIAWDGYSRENNKDYYMDRNYPSLLRYIVDEIGASTERNVCAICVDLAKQNGISLGELFRKYQGVIK